MTDAVMDQRPSYPPYAVQDLGGLKAHVPPWLGERGIDGVRSWKTPGYLNSRQAEDHINKIKTFLQGYVNIRRPVPPPDGYEENRVATLFVGDDEDKF